MQIHELTQSRKNAIDEGVLDSIKSAAGTVGSAVAQGAKTYAKNVGREFATSLGFNPGIGAKDSVTQMQKAATNMWLKQVEQLQKTNGGQPLDEPTYQRYLEEFIDQAFFKNQMSLLPAVGKQTVQHAIHNIVTKRNDPAAIANGFGKLVTASSQTKVDPRAALEKWKGKVMSVNLNQGGVVRPANFSWDGTNWIDALSGQVAPGVLAQKLTRAALGQI
jgi:hypothetical protein